MNRLDILAHLALVPQDVPDVVAAGNSLKNIANRHAAVGADTPDDGLAMTALTPEEEALVEKIRLSQAGEGGLFDVSGLLSVVAFLAKHPQLVEYVITNLLRKKA